FAYRTFTCASYFWPPQYPRAPPAQPAAAFRHGQRRARGSIERLHRPARPADLDPGPPGPSDPEQQPAVVIGQIAGAGSRVAGLSRRAGGDAHPRPQSVAVAPLPHQGEADPVVLPGSVVAQQDRRLVVAGDEDVGVTVVVV